MPTLREEGLVCILVFNPFVAESTQHVTACTADGACRRIPPHSVKLAQEAAHEA